MLKALLHPGRRNILGVDRGIKKKVSNIVTFDGLGHSSEATVV